MSTDHLAEAWRLARLADRPDTESAKVFLGSAINHLTARITEILRQSGVLLPIGGMDYRTPERRQEVLAALLAAAAEEHYRPRVIEKVEQPYCWSQGPRIGHESTPICFEEPEHSGPHRSHPGSGFNEQWGDPAYPVPECQRHEWWSPGAGE